VVGDYENLVGGGSGMRFPSLDAAASEFISYRNRVFSQYSAYRRRLEMRWAINYHYMIDNQWLDLVVSSIPLGGSGTYALKILQAEKDGVPRPVTNILAPNLEIELATYNKRQYIPKVVAASNDPADMDVAKRSTAVLRNRAVVDHWPQVRNRAGLHLVVAGTGVIRTWWDGSYTKTQQIMSPLAQMCSACGEKLAAPEFPSALKEKIRTNTDTLQPVVGDPLSLKVTDCPSCGARGTMRDAEINEADLKYRDIFGRSLAVHVPVGDPAMEALDLFCVYPENGAVGVSYDTWRIMGSCTPRSLDWIADRQPGWASQLRPDNQTSLLRRNPLLGEFSAFGWYNSAADNTIYQDHALYYELIHLPGYRFPKGAIVRSCGQLVEVSELMWDYEDKDTGFTLSVPRAMYSCGVWAERPGEFFGHSMFDRGRSIQNRINGGDSQVIDIHERMANPHIMAATDMNTAGPEWWAGRYSGKILRYERSPLAAEDKPMVFGGVSAPSGLFQEGRQRREDARFVLGPAEIEIGGSPKNVTTTSGLQLQSENAEQRRSPREESMDFISKSVWEHYLKMEQGFRVDDTSYEVEDKKQVGQWRTEVYNRVHLWGRLRLEIEKTAFVSKSIYDREATREAQADGLYIVTKPKDRKRLLELRGLPADVNEDDNLQVDAAESKWACFLKEGKIPTLDPTLDNPAIHFDVLSTRLLCDDGRRLATLAGWEGILPKLTDWPLLLQQRQQLDAIARQAYGQWSTEEEMLQMYAQAMAAFPQQQAEYQQAVEQYDLEAPTRDPLAPPPPPPIAPTQPVQPIVLPRPLDKQILTVWKEMLERSAPTVPTDFKVPQELMAKGIDPARAYQEVLDTFLRFRAVVEAYRLMAGGLVQSPGMPAPAPTGQPQPVVGGAPPNAANPPNPTNTVTPGTSQATANASDSVPAAPQ